MNDKDAIYAKKVKKHAIAAKVLRVKRRLRNTRNRLAYTCKMPLSMRFSDGKVSGINQLPTINMPSVADTKIPIFSLLLVLIKTLQNYCKSNKLRKFYI